MQFLKRLDESPFQAVCGRVKTRVPKGPKEPSTRFDRVCSIGANPVRAIRRKRAKHPLGASQLQRTWTEGIGYAKLRCDPTCIGFIPGLF